MAMAFCNGMKEMVVPIDKAGRVVLPKGVREELAINPGDLFKVSVQGNQVTLQLNREKAGFIKRGRALVFSTGGTDLLDPEIIEHIRSSERDSSTPTITKSLPRRKRK
jgi:AbrB family looped-hinge helix DNA binding protein